MVKVELPTTTGMVTLQDRPMLCSKEDSETKWQERPTGRPMAFYKRMNNNNFVFLEKGLVYQLAYHCSTTCFFFRHDFEQENVCFEMLLAMISEHQCSRATTSWETREWFIFGHPSRSSPRHSSVRQLRKPDFCEAVEKQISAGDLLSMRKGGIPHPLQEPVPQMRR